MSDAKDLAERLRELRATAEETGLVQSIALPSVDLDAILAALEDAERYRWLRASQNDPEIYIGVDSVNFPGNWALFEDEADAAIDAQMGQDYNRAEELDRANVGLAEEVRVLRERLGNLVDAVDGCADMDEMDGPEFQVASKRLEAATEAARPHTEAALLQGDLLAAAQEGKP
jgi:hypothetical protein